MIQVPWAPWAYRAGSHGTLPSRSLNKLKSVLISPGSAIFLAHFSWHVQLDSLMVAATKTSLKLRVLVLFSLVDE